MCDHTTRCLCAIAQELATHLGSEWNPVTHGAPDTAVLQTLSGAKLLLSLMAGHPDLLSIAAMRPDADFPLVVPLTLPADTAVGQLAEVIRKALLPAFRATWGTAQRTLSAPPHGNTDEFDLE